MNDISSMINTFTCIHIRLSASVNARSVHRNAALQIVIPFMTIAADPVYAVNKNVLSVHIEPSAMEKSKQNRLATVTAVLFQAPAGPVRNINNWLSVTFLGGHC